MFELIFHPDAYHEIHQLDKSMKAKALSALDKLESRGNDLRYPDTDIIQDGLFELRAGKKDISRTFFAFAQGQRIFILRTFIKKTPRTPQAEIAIALKRLDEVIDES